MSRLRGGQVILADDLAFQQEVDYTLARSVGFWLKRCDLLMGHQPKLDELVDQIIVSCGHCRSSRFKTPKREVKSNMRLAKPNVNAGENMTSSDFGLACAVSRQN